MPVVEKAISYAGCDVVHMCSRLIEFPASFEDEWRDAVLQYAGWTQQGHALVSHLLASIYTFHI